MRWRVPDVPAELRKSARDAARAAGLPLGAWLERAIRQAQESSDTIASAGRNGAAPAARGHPVAIDPAAVDAAAPTVSSGEPAPENSSRTGGPVAMPQSAGKRPVERRAAIALAALAIVALVGGAIVLWHIDPAPRAKPDTAVPSQPVPSAQPQAARPPSPSQPPPENTAPAQPDAPPTAAEIAHELRQAAEAGDAMAQHDLALAYIDGRGVPQNYQLAAEWFEKAAAAGLERARFNLAVLYENGLGVPADPARAVALYSAAAEQGFAPAQHSLGVAYAEGRGTARDYRAAALWFRRAAEQGIVPAQFNLGAIYEQGLAGPPDPQTAYGWYRRAAANGSNAAVARLAALESRIAAPAPGGPARKPAKPTTREIAEIQQLLNDLSFEAGPADGKPGKATREAIRQYQQAAGMPVDGEPSKDLLAHLRQVTAMMQSGGR